MPPDDRLRWREGVAFGTATLAVRLPTLISRRWYDRDEASIAMISETVRRGGRMYAEMTDRKPPLAPAVWRLGSNLAGGPDPRLVRLIVALLVAAATVLFTADSCRRLGRRAGLWAGALLGAGLIGFAPADSGAANYAHVAVPFAIVAVVAVRRPSWRWAVVGGALLGLAVMARQSWIYAVPAAGLSGWMAARWRGLAGVLVGFAAVFFGVALFVPWSEFWFWTFAGNTNFLLAGTAPGDVAIRLLASGGMFIAFHVVQVIGAARQASRWRVDTDLWLWLITAIGAAATGFRFFGHYWLQAVPPLALLAAPGVASASDRVRRTAAALVAVATAVAVTFLLFPASFRDVPDPGALAAAIQRRSTAEQPVFIWGNEPELAIAMDRPIAGTQVHTDFVTGRSGGRNTGDTRDEATPGALRRMLADLTAHPPAVIVDTSTAPDRHYTNYPLTYLPEIATLVAAGYAVDTVVEGVTLYVRVAP